MPHVEDDLNRIIEAVRFIEPDALAPIQPGTDVDRVVQWVRDQREEILSLSRQASNFEQQLLASRRANDGMTQTLNERVAKLKAKDEEIKQLRTTLLRDVDGLQQKVKEKDDEITQLIKETVELEHQCIAVTKDRDTIRALGDEAAHRRDSLINQRDAMEKQRDEAKRDFNRVDATYRINLGELSKVRDERDELQRVFDLSWKATMAATTEWRAKHPGNDNVIPDRKDLIEWMIDQMMETRRINHDLATSLDHLRQHAVGRQPDEMTIANLRSELDYVKKQLGEKQSKEHDEAFRRERVITTARMLMVAGVQSGKFDLAPVEDFLNSAAGFWSEVDRRFPPKS